MNCTQTRNLIHAFVDGELDLVRQLEIEHHLQDCPACAREHEELKALGASLRAPGFYHLAPPRLHERLRAVLAKQDPPRPGRRPLTRWLVQLAAAVLLLVAGWSGAGQWAPLSGLHGDDRLSDEVVAGHVRSLLATHLTDVASSDRHTVKPWFAGKIDFAPPVRDLSAHGFTLIGGRLDYLDRRPVAALIYQRREHVINVFVWPADTDAGELRTESRRGFQVIRVTRSGLTSWVVSDLNLAELEEFVQRLGES